MPRSVGSHVDRPLPIWYIVERGAFPSSRQRTGGSFSSFLPKRRQLPAKCLTSGKRRSTKRSIAVRFLLDVNVLVGLAFPLHASHQTAHSWFRRERDRLWATCPSTQAGFLGVASRALGGTRDAVQQALAGLERDCLLAGGCRLAGLERFAALAPARTQPSRRHPTPAAGSPSPGTTRDF